MQTFRSTVFRKEEKHENEALGRIFSLSFFTLPSCFYKNFTVFLSKGSFSLECFILVLGSHLWGSEGNWNAKSVFLQQVTVTQLLRVADAKARWAKQPLFGLTSFRTAKAGNLPCWVPCKFSLVLHNWTTQYHTMTLHFKKKYLNTVRLNISLSRAEANGHPELASQKVAASLSELLHLLSWAIVSPSPVEKNRFCISDVSRLSPAIRIVLFFLCKALYVCFSIFYWDSFILQRKLLYHVFHRQETQTWPH